MYSNVIAMRSWKKINEHGQVIATHNQSMNAESENAPGSKNVSIKKTASRWITNMSHQNSFAQLRRWHKVQSDMQLHEQRDKEKMRRKETLRNPFETYSFSIFLCSPKNVSDYSASLSFLTLYLSPHHFPALPLRNLKLHLQLLQYEFNIDFHLYICRTLYAYNLHRKLELLILL